MFELIGPLAVLFAVVGFYLIVIGMHGQMVDAGARLCRRCRFDVRGVPDRRCPECGGDVSGPAAIITGMRQRRAWVVALGVLCFLPALGGFAAKRVLVAKGVNSLWFVSEERLLDQFILASQEWRRYDEFTEIERRYAAGELSSEAIVAFAEAVLARTAGMEFISSIHPEKREVDLATAMVLNPQYPAEARQRLFADWMEGQASRRDARWSVVWGDVLVRANAMGLLTAHQFEQFMTNGLEVEVFVDEDEPVRPGQRVWIAMRWRVRLGDSWAGMRGIDGVVSVPGLDEWCWAPRVSVGNGRPDRIGRVTAPSAPGEYEVAGTVGVSLAGGLDQLVRMIPKQKPDLTTANGLDWVARVSCSYTVVPEAPNHEVDAAE